ncbi:hyaluronidase PH-20 [Ctenodactylus gundi]
MSFSSRYREHLLYMKNDVPMGALSADGASQSFLDQNMPKLAVSGFSPFMGKWQWQKESGSNSCSCHHKRKDQGLGRNPGQESFVEFGGTLQAVFLFLLISRSLTTDVRAPPLIPNVPLLWGWNAPTEICLGVTGKNIDMSLYSMVGTPRKNVTGQSITLYYVDRLGLYPYIDHSGTIIHGGIPQMGNLQDHLNKSRQDILYYMPTDNVGLAVIDWEEWRPLWARNWKPKDIYRNKSIALVLSKNSQLNNTAATDLAKKEFEKTGKDFMMETLKLGINLRPNSLWGYYLFPDCYNHHYSKADYDGHCPDVEKKRNDELSWMWTESTALYPSVYLNTRLRSNPKAALFVRSRVNEAIRTSKIRDPKNPLPVYVYVRLVFTDQILIFLSEKSCLELEAYKNTVLDPYIINVTLAAKMCSQVLCQEQGVCTRKDWDTSSYLHLNPSSFAIQLGQNGKHVVSGKPTLEDLQEFVQNFHCSCYSNLNCRDRLDVENTRSINVCVTNDICIDTSLNFDKDVIDKDYEEDSGDLDVSSSATLSPRVPGKDITWGLLLLSLYSQS